MRTVWKAPITPNSLRGEPYPITVRAKQHARPLAVMKQDGRLYLWFEVVTEDDDADLTIYCVGTGFGEPPAGTQYFASVSDGDYVWHFYREPEE